MNRAILTGEYPPNVYGGAGAHVEQHFSWRAVGAQTLAFYERLLRA